MAIQDSYELNAASYACGCPKYQNSCNCRANNLQEKWLLILGNCMHFFLEKPTRHVTNLDFRSCMIMMTLHFLFFTLVTLTLVTLTWFEILCCLSCIYMQIPALGICFPFKVNKTVAVMDLEYFSSTFISRIFGIQ